MTGLDPKDVDIEGVNKIKNYLSSVREKLDPKSKDAFNVAIQEVYQSFSTYSPATIEKALEDFLY